MFFKRWLETAGEDFTGTNSDDREFCSRLGSSAGKFGAMGCEKTLVPKKNSTVFMKKQRKK